MTTNKAVSLNSPNLSTLALDALAKGAGGVKDLVGKSIVGYKAMGGVLHQAACAALFHAMQTGDSRPLSTFFNGIKKNDQDALKIWVGKHVRIPVLNHDESGIEDAAGEPELVTVMRFKKDTAFEMVKGKENLRVGFLDIHALLSGPSFQDTDQAKETKAFGLIELLAMLARVQKQVDKRAEDNDIAIPAEIVAALASLNKTVASVQVSVGVQ